MNIGSAASATGPRRSGGGIAACGAICCPATSSARQTRGDLVEHARLADAGEDILEAIDAAVLSELLQVILRRSPSALAESRVDGMALMQAASALGGICAAA